VGGGGEVSKVAGTAGSAFAGKPRALRQERLKLEAGSGGGPGGRTGVGEGGGGGGGAWDVRTGLYMDGDEGADRRKKTIFITGATGAIGR